MIDIENEIYTAIATDLRTNINGITVSGEYDSESDNLPFATIVERINTVHLKTQDSGSVENHADLMYEANVFTSGDGKKTLAKLIMNRIDTIMASKGFTRNFNEPTPNFKDKDIHKRTARWKAVVGTDKTVYRG